MKFLQKLGNAVVKMRVFFVVFWVAAAVVLYLTAPSLSSVARSDETSFLGSDTETAKATALYERLFPGEGGHSSFILVLTDAGGLNDADRQYGRDVEQYLLANKSKYNIEDVVSPLTKTEYAKQMLSADGQSIIIKASLTTGSYKDETNEAVRNFRSDLKSASAPAAPAKLAVNVTGDAPLGQEYIDNVQKSLDLMTKITVVLIIVILLLIYRSPLAPVLPLATIGLSFLISRGVIALLTTLGYKVSSFTEIFLIAVLFGAGTDYCMLLISRFREEIVSGKTPKEALSAAFPHTLAAIVCSGCAVIIGFACMGLAKFGLYSTTGPSIAIGVAVAVLAVLTLTPSLLALFGEAIFWPAHPSKNREREQAGSPFWNKMAASVTKRPLIYMLVTLAIFTPFVVFSVKVSRTYDSLKELPQSSDTVQGFEALKAHFDQGEMMPAKIVLTTDKDVWQNTSLQAVDNIAAAVCKVEGVARVRTATRPAGAELSEISLPTQIEALLSGLNTSAGGFDTLASGLKDAKAGVDKVADGLNTAASGMGQLSGGVDQATGGLATAGTGLTTLSKSQADAIAGLGKIKNGLNGLTDGMDQGKAGLDTMTTALTGVKTYLTGLAAMNPALAADPNYKTAYGAVAQMLANIPALSSGYDQMKGGVYQAQAGLNDDSAGLGQIKDGIDRSKAGLDAVITGLGQVKSGQGDAGKKLTEASAGLKAVSSGLQQAIDGITAAKGQLSDAGQAAKTWADGLKGLNSVFYLPSGVLDKYPELKTYMQAYISKDSHGVTFDVVLSLPPYGSPALDTVPKIEDAVRFALNGSALEGAEFHISGTTAAYNEVRQVTSDDYIIVMVSVLLGIFIVLALLLRSLTAPVYLIATILLSYFTTMGISWLVFHFGMGKEGLSWAVPFYSFCLLVALGVDYNIFLMTRVREEYKPNSTREGVRKALASTGGIITSCGIIMAGTFAALLSSPLPQLYEIAFTTVVGLLLDTFIVRCMLVPSLVVGFGELNWWPGKKIKVLAGEETDKKN